MIIVATNDLSLKDTNMSKTDLQKNNTTMYMYSYVAKNHLVLQIAVPGALCIEYSLTIDIIDL